MNQYNQQFKDLLPRDMEYGFECYDGNPVIQGVAFNDLVYWLCLRCGEIHHMGLTAPPGQLVKNIDQCGKCNVGDEFIYYTHEISIDSALTGSLTVQRVAKRPGFYPKK